MADRDHSVTRPRDENALNKLTLKLEDLDLAQPEVLLLLSVVADVDELPRVTVPVVAEENRLLLLEFALELGARLVHRLVALQEFCEGQRGDGHFRWRK